ncbi:NAD-dependent epimerase/dehydratase family protein [Mucilaginibacter sabulilitoris]|uniref:NAD-dependent epimerase/dehydratase family protein n=1 Tax=Mucilaginibacter sabulilitoris TaxID=1173583 RepID=A0ABZ0TEK1_9SPHI|nr:NAD-dependent epimerase/dehydratase family protein [Mucilaginibacter sabulilitoris]WPU91616.1 NAD-dependent epimerase/dehydratase family protein [Mucilaginibacter sabulilitoris]
MCWIPIGLKKLVNTSGTTQIYHLAAMLLATGEQFPKQTWDVKGLLNVLEVARQEKVSKVFWFGSIAVFGPDSPREFCPQHTVTEPVTVYGISKCAEEYWCRYYFEHYGLDLRSLRYPGSICPEKLLLKTCNIKPIALTFYSNLSYRLTTR